MDNNSIRTKNITNSINRNLKFSEIKEYVKSDYFRFYGKIETKRIIKDVLLGTGLCYNFWLRCCFSNNRLIKKFSDKMRSHYGRKFGLDVPPISIGYGFYLAHRQNVVINSFAKIGNNVTITQFTTIGSLKGTPATIGDNVYIGPSVSIIEDVHIGNNVTIGGGQL